MKERTKRIVGRSLDEALALEVVNLFGVLNRAPDEEEYDAYERFQLGLNKAVELYESLLHDLDLEGESHG